MKPSCLLILSVLLALPGSLHGRVWISEFVASNATGHVDKDGDAEDWLELHNDGTEAVELGGWSLTDEESELRKWIIPGVSIPGGGYLVIFASGENRRTPGEELHTNFSLSKSGEYLALVRADGVTVEHEYAPEYPGQFEDASFGLAQTGEFTSVVLAQGAPGRAGVPGSAADFAAEYAGWNSDVGGSFGGSTWRDVSSGVGYDQDDVYGTWLGVGGDFEAELLNANGSIFLRLPFTVTAPGDITQVSLRMRWDDGFIAYINGVQVAANREPAAPDWDSLATSEREVGANDDWVSLPVDLTQVTLLAGENLLAIHGLNHTVDSPDLLVLPELEVTKVGIDAANPVYHLGPTPGRANGPGATVLPPLLTDVTSSVEQPAGGGGSPPLVITANVRETLNPISEVRLYHRRQFVSEIMVPMRDDGVAPDEFAGDDVFSAEVPTAVARGNMIRWRVEAEDTEGETSIDPPFEVSTDADRYYGTVAADANLRTTQLPVLHTFVQNENAVNQRSGGRVSMYFLGRFYDNVQMDLHGQSTASFPKKSYDVDFNRGNRFLWKEGEGKVKDINLLTNWADKSKVRNTMGYEFLKRCGTPYHFAFPVRVQRNASFFSVADMVEDGDDRYLDRVGLDGNGALYKMYDRMADPARAVKKTRKHENTSDLAALESRLATTLNRETRRRFAYDLVNLPATVNYLASITVAGISDVGHKNFYLYRDTEGTGEWQPLPWDVDLSAGRRWTSSETYFHDPLHWDYWNAATINRLWELMFFTPDFRDMYLRRVATLREEILLPPGTAEADDWFTQRIHELEDLVDPALGRSDADLDYLKWGRWGNEFQMRQASARILTEWLPNKRSFMFSASRNQGGVPVPALQPAVPDVTIDTIEFNPVSGNQDEEYFVLKNNEPASVDLSGWTVSGAVDFVIPPGTVIPAGTGASNVRYVGLLHVPRRGEAFRLRRTGPRGGQYRLVVGGYDGQLSARGETIEVRTKAGDLVVSETYDGDPTPPQSFLRITELSYHPTLPTAEEEGALPGVTAEDFEWIEFLNTGTEALDLEGVHFTDGIEFVFGAVLLGGGERLILARNPAAFALRYPDVTVPVAGPYRGYLENDGEHLRLVDAGGENVLSFDYNDRWYPPTDGGGPSLVLRDEATAWNLYDDPESWGISKEPAGSAGVESVGYLVHFNGWQSSQFTSAEREDPLIGTALANPDGDSYANWEEYALGLNPLVPDEGLFRGAIVPFGGKEHLGATVRRRSDTVDLSWGLQVSPDGQAWTTIPAVSGKTTRHGDGTETWTVREAAEVGESPMRFSRMKVSLVD